MNWEMSAVPYWPIARRARRRRLVLAAWVAFAAAAPVLAWQRHEAITPVGEKVFDEVAQTVAVRYFDPRMHDVDWRRLVSAYRPRVIAARDARQRYVLLNAMLAQLHDSHTAVFPPAGARADGGGPGGIEWSTIKPGVGYLRLAAFPDSIADILGWAVHDLRANRVLVLDLRGNPGGLVDSVDAAAGIFLPAGTLVSSGSRRVNIFGVPRFVASGAAGVRYSGKLVVLVDERTQSGAEALANALHFYRRATIVGRPTPGRVLGVEVEETLPDGGVLRVATIDMFGPDGRRLEGRGVWPDVVVSRTDALRAALRLARSL